MVKQYRLRQKDFAFFSESDIHHSLASLLNRKNVDSVHVEFQYYFSPIETRINNIRSVAYNLFQY